MMRKIAQETRVDEMLDTYPSLSRRIIEFGLPCQNMREPFCGTVDELGKQHNVNINGPVDKLDERKRQLDEKS